MSNSDPFDPLANTDKSLSDTGPKPAKDSRKSASGRKAGAGPSRQGKAGAAKAAGKGRSGKSSSGPLSAEQSGQRIAKLLARAGVASRREVERMIADGRISLDGEILTSPATLLEDLHGVAVDGKPVKQAAPSSLWRFHKPGGLLTAERDPKGRPTIYTQLQRIAPDGPRMMPVGRLDMNTEGLLLMTNDGELKRLLELPSTGVERSYRARAFGMVSQQELEELIHGVTIDGVHYGRIDANLERRTGRNQWIELTLKEGKNREVRRVLEHLGLKVSRLIRTRYGPFTLEGLERGALDKVRSSDLAKLKKSLEKAVQKDRN